MNIGAVMTEGGYPDLTDIESDINPVYQIYDIGAMKSQMIVSVKFVLIPSRNVSEKNHNTRCATGQEISVEGM